MREDESALEAEIRAASSHTDQINVQNRSLGNMLDEYARVGIAASPFRKSR